MEPPPVRGPWPPSGPSSHDNLRSPHVHTVNLNNKFTPSTSPPSSSGFHGVQLPALHGRSPVPKPRSSSTLQTSKQNIVRTSSVGTSPERLGFNEQMDLSRRYDSITRHFPAALGVDDFIARLEIALSGFGFTGDNSIAMTSLCRDEVTFPLRDKIESVFGSCFSTNGLGAVMTCGLTGMQAGLHHSPIMSGKEQYVFFAFPHIAINAAGEVGAIARPGRPTKSCACGALAKCLGEFKSEGFMEKIPGVHDPLDPEYSILKHRLARRAKAEKMEAANLDLVSITRLAERTIGNDLEFLISKAVELDHANYAVVTGVQIHNWASDLSPESRVPSLEFVAPTRVYVVVDGKRTNLDLTRVPALSARQLRLMAQASLSSGGGQSRFEDDGEIARTGAGTLEEVPLNYLTRRLGVAKNVADYPGIQPTWTPGIAASLPRVQLSALAERDSVAGM